MGIEHPDWLPVGWKVTVKARPTGKKDKYYLNPSIGLKLKSRPEVLKYLEGSVRVQKPEKVQKTEMVQKAKNPVKINIKKTVALDLPPGWSKEIRTTKRHDGKTRRDPTYIDPVSGHRFRSMQEVYRYIESGEVRRKAKADPDATKSKRRPLASEAKEQRVIDKKADENIIRYKRVRSGRKVAGGLKGAVTKNENMPEDDTFPDQSGEVCLAIEFSDKLRKVKQRAQKLREIKKLADNTVAQVVEKDQTPKSGAVNDREPCTDGRRQSKRLADIKLKANVNKYRSLQSGSKGSAENNINKPAKKPVFRGLAGQSKKESSKKPVIGGLEGQNEIESSKNPVIGSSEGQNKKESSKKPVIGGLEGQNKIESSKKPVIGGSEGQNKKESLKKPVIGSSGQNKEESSNMIDGLEGQNKTESSKNPVIEGSEGPNKRERSKRKWTGDLPRRTSQRIAHVEADPSLEVKTSKKAGGNGEADVSDTKCTGSEHKEKCRSDQPADDHEKKVVTPGEQNSAGSEHKENETHEKQLDSSLANLLMDPCIEFAIKTLTGVIPIEDASKVSNGPTSSLASNQALASSSVLPSATVNIWADPCFEFAVKTLTSETPMLKPTTQVQITFQQPFVGGCDSPTVPKLRSDNLCTLKQSSKKPCVGQ